MELSIAYRLRLYMDGWIHDKPKAKTVDSQLQVSNNETAFSDAVPFVL